VQQNPTLATQPTHLHSEEQQAAEHGAFQHGNSRPVHVSSGIQPFQSSIGEQYGKATPGSLCFLLQQLQLVVQSEATQLQHVWCMDAQTQLSRPCDSEAKVHNFSFKHCTCFLLVHLLPCMLLLVLVLLLRLRNICSPFFSHPVFAMHCISCTTWCTPFSSITPSLACRSWLRRTSSTRPSMWTCSTARACHQTTWQSTQLAPCLPSRTVTQ
jgi:hypothetical protein